MIKKTRILSLSIASAFAVGAAAVASLAWFVTDNKIPSIDINGTSNGAYFAYGNGSAESPFGIATPRQLYNLSWLQYHGMFNEDKNNDGVIDKQFYFELAEDLDMTGWELPPIGTERNPFLGNFNGNSHVISNLIVSNKATFDKKPVSISYDVQPEIVGFFGVVGEGVGNLGYSYDSSVNALYDFTLDDLTVESKTSQTLIGLAGGYVNGEMSGINIDGEAKLDVNGQTSTAISSITNKLSDYGLVGYTTKTGSKGTYAQELSEYYENGAGSGGDPGQEWGNSIDMRSLYNRLSQVYNGDSYDSGSFTVNTAIDPNGNVTKQKVENLNNHFSGYYVNDHSYTFNKHATGNQDFYFLYGDYSPVSGTETSIIYEEEFQNVTSTQYKISQSSETMYRFTTTVNGTAHYVKMPTLTSASSGNVLVQDTTNINDATLFVRIANGNSGAYRYYTEQIIKGTSTKVYLGCKTGGSLYAYAYNVDTTNNKNYTSWITSGTNYYVVYNSKNYYMRLNNTQWQGNSSTTSNRATTQEVSFTNYLNAVSSGACSPTTEAANAVIWYYENNKLFTIFDDKMYFLIGKGGALSVSNMIARNNATSWTFSNNAFTYSYNGTTYYMDFAASATSVTSKPNNIVMNNVGTANLPNQLYVDSITESSSAIPYNSFKNSYLPLATTQDIYTTHSRNSGYIISGKHYINDNYDSGGEPGYYNSGDIRVSRYSMDNINVSLGQDTFDNSKLYAITATSNSDYALITDSHNSGATAGSGLSSITARKASTNLYRYNDWDNNTGARDALGNVFTSDSSNIYGLHFMDASISTSNTVVVPGAKMGGKTYSSGLEMPKDSIDFLVNENGYITFFAGTYFSNNSSFFSLHKIERNSSTNAITSITEIQTIYKDAANNYYYNPTSTANLTKVFDTEVLTSPTTFINNAVYYFEIPVGPGEYALGSVSGTNGAYLMYLDISASGEVSLKDDVQAYNIKTESTANSFPSGVDFIPISVDGNGGETIAVSIDSGKKGVLILSVASNDISVTDSSSIAAYAYRSPDNYTPSSPGDGEFTCNLSGDPPTVAQGGTRVLMINLTTTLGDDYVIRITDVLNLNGTIASSTYEMDSGSGFVSTNESTIAGLSNEIDISAFRSLAVAATLTRTSGTGEFTTTYDGENCSYEDKTIDVDIERNGTTISIGVTTDYTFKIGGVQYNNGSTYPST